MNDSRQWWDDVLAEIPVECGHCHGPMSLLSVGVSQPHYECLQQLYVACITAATPAVVVEDYVAHHVLGEVAKPPVADRLTKVLYRWVKGEQPQYESGHAVLEVFAGIAIGEGEIDPEELRRCRNVTQQYMDEDTFSPRWLADWWNQRAKADSRRRLCRLFLTKVELRSGPTPAAGVLNDARITLHWRVWEPEPAEAD